jgi:hypothetical protein
MLCRVLLGLERAATTGTLLLDGEGRRARIAIEAGMVAGANIDRRVPSSSRQLLDALIGVAEWNELSLRFLDQATTTSWWRLAAPIAAGALSLDCMRVLGQGIDSVAIRAELGPESYHLTDAGEALLKRAELRPDETAVVFPLRRGATAEELLNLPGSGLAGTRFLLVLKRLRGAAPRGGGSYPLLLRKRRELRRQASARVLLDLPECANDGDARKALRKLVRDLHPDRFGEGVPPALRRASGEIVTALVHAEAAIAANRAD